MARWISIGAVIIIIAAAASYFLFPASRVNAPTNGGETPTTQNPSRDDLIFVTSHKEGDTISSPVTIKGEARGYWYFEASFPVIIVDWDGRIIAQVPAQAKGDWMTTDYVPFEVTLTFDTPTPGDPSVNRGAIILRKDNPSGLPENDDALEIPIVFE